jgi:hypothetical protein
MVHRTSDFVDPAWHGQSARLEVARRAKRLV